MSFQKAFDVILAEIIQDFNNMDPARDTSQGSPTFVDAACMASALWGIYKFIGYVKNQISPLTSDSEFLTKHASQYGISRISGEKDDELLIRLLARLQHPPAGGNQYDYIAWAKEVSMTHTTVWAASHEYVVNDVIVGGNSGYLFICKIAGESGSSEPTWTTDPGDEITDNEVTWQVWETTAFVERVDKCYLFSHTRSMGSIDLVILSNYMQIESGNGLFASIPSNALRAAVLAYIMDKGPVCAYDYLVLAPLNKTTTITITVPAGITTQGQRDKIKTDIMSFLTGLEVGDTLYRASLISICVDNGVPNFTDIVPANDVECYPDESHPDEYERIWACDANGDLIITVVED